MPNPKPPISHKQAYKQVKKSKEREPKQDKNLIKEMTRR